MKEPKLVRNSGRERKGGIPEGMMMAFRAKGWVGDCCRGEGYRAEQSL